MGASWTRLGILLVAVLVAGVLPGCAKKAPPAPPPPGITYEVGQGAELANVAWYVKDEVLVVDVSVKNATTAAKKFDVGGKVDDGAFFFAGPEAEKEVKAGATLKYPTQSALSTPYPKKLVIKIAPL